ncbi:MAG: DUF1311 domain-containing protein [Candidatus Delongbacteria bacterium]|nr:DUF1311 domain-containing protein [Candidatus Delongbacteria bacterium]
MNYIKKILILLLTIIVSNVAFSQIDQKEHRLDDVYKECCNKQHGDYGALSCAIDVSKEWNKEMNKYYTGLMNVLDTNAQEDLRLAQEQWTRYRDLEYKFSNSLHDMQGTMYLRLRALRSMRIVRARALELKSYYWVRTEEEELKGYKLNADQVVTQESKVDTILPTPDSTFFSSLDSIRINNADHVIENYINSYFDITKKKEVIEKASLDHTEIPGEDCRYRTEYGNIVIEEDYGCDSYFQTTTIEFKNYSFDEVKRILKVLLPKEYNREDEKGYGGSPDGWEENGHYYNYGGNCHLDIIKGENKIIVQYGCSC